MKFLAAHKLAVILGLALIGGAVLFLRRKSTSGADLGAAGDPYAAGVPVSPYSDSQAPQFSFDFGSMLSQGSQLPDTSATNPGVPNGVPLPTSSPTGILTPPGGQGGHGGTAGPGIHWFGPGGSGVFYPPPVTPDEVARVGSRLSVGSHPIVSLPIVRPQSTTSTHTFQAV